LVGEVLLKAPSLIGNDPLSQIAGWESIGQAPRGDLVVARCRCLVVLAMVLVRYVGCGAMSLLSHAGDVATEATWPWCDVHAHANMMPGLICI
jgi:hypothetical protein